MINKVLVLNVMSRVVQFALPTLNVGQEAKYSPPCTLMPSATPLQCTGMRKLKMKQGRVSNDKKELLVKKVAFLGSFWPFRPSKQSNMYDLIASHLPVDWEREKARNMPI